MIAPLLALAAGLFTDGIPARSTEFAALEVGLGLTPLCPQWAHDYATSGDYSTYAYNTLEWGADPPTRNCLSWCTATAHNPDGRYQLGIPPQPWVDPINEMTKTAATTSACAWVAVCVHAAATADAKNYCMKRTAAAMGVIYGESYFSPIAQAWDRNGRGLIQFDYYNSVDGEVRTSAC